MSTENDEKTEKLLLPVLCTSYVYTRTRCEVLVCIFLFFGAPEPFLKKEWAHTGNPQHEIEFEFRSLHSRHVGSSGGRLLYFVPCCRGCRGSALNAGQFQFLKTVVKDGVVKDQVLNNFRPAWKLRSGAVDKDEYEDLQMLMEEMEAKGGGSGEAEPLGEKKGRLVSMPAAASSCLTSSADKGKDDALPAGENCLFRMSRHHEPLRQRLGLGPAGAFVSKSELLLLLLLLLLLVVVRVQLV